MTKRTTVTQVTQISQTQIVAIADTLVQAIKDDPENRISIDQIDDILKMHGIDSIKRGRLGRDDWNFSRLRLLARISRHLRETQHEVLKVVSRPARGVVIYSLVPATRDAVSATWNTTSGFERRLRRDLRNLSKEFVSLVNFPEHASQASIADFHETLNRKFARYIDMIVEDIVLAARQEGLIMQMPEPLQADGYLSSRPPRRTLTKSIQKNAVAKIGAVR